MMKISCCQYQIEKLTNWEEYRKKVEFLISSAKRDGADIFLMPEYAGIEIACDRYATDLDLYSAIQSLIPQYVDFYKRLARHYQICIQSGTIIQKVDRENYVNRAYFFGIDGSIGYQDKLQLTAYEKNLGFLQRGTSQKIFETPFGRMGIAICYDSEFPEVFRFFTQRGVSIVLVPSYTVDRQGYNRVSLCCRARAIENQCYVAVSYVVGRVDVDNNAETTEGKAAIFSPVDKGFPDDGILIEGNRNKPMIITAAIDLEKLDFVRKHGAVHNFEDALGLG